jgi:hypothetical protein
MRVKTAGSTLVLAALIALSQSGCKKSSDTDNRSKVITGTVDTNLVVRSAIPTNAISHLHWNGMKRVRLDPNAATFLKFWDEPHAVALQGHVLDKLAQSPWYPQTSMEAVVTNRETTLLRSLLDDVVQEESFFEIAHPTNGPGTIALAIHLDPQRAATWETNLASILESLSDSHAQPLNGSGKGWTLAAEIGGTTQRCQIEFTHAGEWTVIGFGFDSNAVFDELVAQCKQDWIPYSRNPRQWLDTRLDFHAIDRAFPLRWGISTNFPVISLSLAAENPENVLTRADFAFPEAPLGKLDQWTIPTNLVLQPFIGFTAARGIAPILKQWPLLSGLNADEIPNQLYVWDRPGPFHLFFAFPINDATACLSNVAPRLMNLINPKLRPVFGALTPETNGLRWVGSAYAEPFLQVETNSSQQVLAGGFGPRTTAMTKPMPEEIITHLDQTTNLVFFDWENTGLRTVHWRYLDDVYRMIFDLHGLRLNWTPSFDWFQYNMTNLSFSVTEVKQIDDRHLTLGRRSTLGLTGLELDLLANWIEMPEFPRGFGHFMATNPAPVIRRSRLSEIQTNSQAAPKQK